MNLPKTRDTDRTGNLAVTKVQSIVEERSWKFRRQDGVDDFGVDAEVEVVDSNRVTGKVVKCQIKGSGGVNWDGDIARVQVNVSTYNMWRAINLPIVAFLCDVSDNTVYWNLPLSQTPRPGAETIALRFVRENRLPQAWDALEGYLRSWFSSFSFDELLRGVPFFHSICSELSDEVDGGDRWSVCGFDPKICALYRFVLQLRNSLALSNEEIMPITDWYVRNYAIYQEDELMHGTFSEMFLFLKPCYDEAIDELLKRLKQVQPLEDVDGIAAVLEALTPNDKRVAIIKRLDPRMNDPAFHKAMEDKLREHGALRHQWGQI